MHSSKVIALRAGVVALLLAAMPLLVLPPVVGRIDALFYREDPEALPLAISPAPIQAAPLLAAAPTADAAPVHEPDELNRRLEMAQARLRDLGASYMVLEASGAERRIYHFHCRLPIGEGDACFKPFDASGSDPATTMEHVVRAVESWRDPIAEVQTAGRLGNYR